MTTHEISTQIDIDAPAARVWEVLTDFGQTPAWNPSITEISGVLAQGARLSIRGAAPGKAPTRFTALVLATESNRELRWRRFLILPGLFDREQYFVLEPLGKNRTRLVQGEKFSGLLAGLFRGAMNAAEQGANAMNAALKQQAEEGRAHVGIFKRFTDALIARFKRS